MNWVPKSPIFDRSCLHFHPLRKFGKLQTLPCSIPPIQQIPNHMQYDLKTILSSPVNRSGSAFPTSIEKRNPLETHKHFARQAASLIMEWSRKDLIYNGNLPVSFIQISITSFIKVERTLLVFTIVSTTICCSLPKLSCCIIEKNPDIECIGLLIPLLITFLKAFLAWLAIKASF